MLNEEGGRCRLLLDLLRSDPDAKSDVLLIDFSNCTIRTHDRSQHAAHSQEHFAVSRVSCAMVLSSRVPALRRHWLKLNGCHWQRMLMYHNSRTSRPAPSAQIWLVAGFLYLFQLWRGLQERGRQWHSWRETSDAQLPHRLAGIAGEDH